MADFDRNTYGYGAGVARAEGAVYDQGLRSYMLGIYNNMTLGLAITGLVALGTYMLAQTTGVNGARVLTPLGVALYTSPLKWVVMLAPLAFILVLSFRFEKMSVPALMGTFLAFAAVMGISMSSIFIVFKMGSIANVFFITSAAFAGLSLYGYTTQRSLSGLGSFLMMGLIGLMLASIVNIFLQSTMLQFAVSCIGVLIFAGLTAYDTQRLKNEYDYVAGDQVAMGKASLMGALSLYLNFINMFQMLLSLFGERE